MGYSGEEAGSSNLPYSAMNYYTLLAQDSEILVSNISELEVKQIKFYCDLYSRLLECSDYYYLQITISTTENDIVMQDCYEIWHNTCIIIPSFKKDNF